MKLPEPHEGMIRDGVFLLVGWALASAAVAGCIAVLAALGAP